MHQLQYLIIKIVSYITIRQLTTLLSTSLANESLIMYASTIKSPPLHRILRKCRRHPVHPGHDTRLFPLDQICDWKRKKELTLILIAEIQTNSYTMYQLIQDIIDCKQEQMVLVSQSSRVSYCYCFNLITLIAPTFSPHNIILENSNKLKFHQHYLNRSINKGASIPMFTEKVF